MEVINKIDSIHKMNKLGQTNCPFLFIIRYDLEGNYILPLNEIQSKDLRYDFSGSSLKEVKHFQLKPNQIDFENYKKGYDIIFRNLLEGNSFLTNLTASTPINIQASLEDIYTNAYAKYKLLVVNQFVCFSPETFVKVNSEGKISTFPMKGTIDAKIPGALEKLRNDKKEKNEHTTIVDLLRNDLSMIANDICVEKFQYVESIKKSNGQEILQMSSKISGKLPSDWKNNLGDWFFKLLPAGSICGAPKAKTLEIINDAEKHLHPKGLRNFYTGVMGIFDGKELDSAVMIRFIEKQDDNYYFKSGGGITHQSDVKKEYDEIYQKLYIPVG